jgi:hypothetical protein
VAVAAGAAVAAASTGAATVAVAAGAAVAGTSVGATAVGASVGVAAGAQETATRISKTREMPTTKRFLRLIIYIWSTSSHNLFSNFATGIRERMSFVGLIRSDCG